jgi:hypothetical protein
VTGTGGFGLAKRTALGGVDRGSLRGVRQGVRAGAEGEGRLEQAHTMELSTIATLTKDDERPGADDEFVTSGGLGCV